MQSPRHSLSKNNPLNISLFLSASLTAHAPQEQTGPPTPSQTTVWVSADPSGCKAPVIVSHILHIHPFTNMPPLASVYLNISFKTDGILILAPSCGILSPIHFPIRQSPSSSPFVLLRYCLVLLLPLPPITQSLTHSVTHCSFKYTMLKLKSVNIFTVKWWSGRTGHWQKDCFWVWITAPGEHCCLSELAFECIHKTRRK